MRSFIARFFSSSMSQSVKSIVEDAIANNKVAVFSKSYCPYCRKAKALLGSTPGLDSADIKIFELDEIDNGPEIQSYLRDKTGQSTVPNVFIKQQHIGGSDNLAAFNKSGQLAKLLEEDK